MGDLWTGTITLAVLLVAIVAVPATVAAQDEQTFVVVQGSECVQITPLGDGTQSVENFYDYRSTTTTSRGQYTSYGTRDIQLSQTSQVFVYAGSEGLSLVFLHDRFGDDDGGFAATADISGLPTDGEWAIEDDSYTNRDDVFRHSATSSHIEWVSNGNRTDGGAFRGLGSSNYRTISIDIAFNDESNRYPFDEWQGSPSQNQLEEWVVRSGSGETTELDMDEPIEISPGTCSGGISTFTPTETATSTSTPTISASAETDSDQSTTAAPIQADESTESGGTGVMSNNTVDDLGVGVATVLAAVVVLLALLALVRQN